MPPTNKVHRHYPQISSCVNDFCLFIRSNQVERLYDMLSPNLKQLVLEERHQERFQAVFVFGRKIHGFDVYSLTEINPVLVETTVIVGLIPSDSEKNYADVATVNDLNYRVYKMRFIDIDGYWYLDEARLFNDFWKTEFKNDHPS